MEDDDLLCPLCCEEIDAVDKYFYPCPCGYQICRFCWNHIREDLNQLCPACRRPFDDESAVFNPVPPDELARLNADRKRRARARQQRYAIDDRSHLKDTKVTQRTLVYVTGLPAKYANEELLKSDNYFGQFGRIVKLNVTRRPPQTVGGKTGENQIAVHITYSAAHEAIRAIQYVDGSLLEGRTLHATFGATKYCAAWLQGRQCTTAICNFLHEVVDNVAANAIVSPRGLPGTRYFGPKGRKQAAAAAAEAERDDDNASTASGPSSAAITRSGSMSSVSATPTATASAAAASSGPALPATASWASKKPESRSTTPNSVRSTSPVTQPPKRTPSTSSTTSKRSITAAPIDAFPPPSAAVATPTPTRAKKDPAKKQAAREAREQRERELLEKQERERLAAIREAKARAMAIAEAEATERARVEAEARAAAEAKAKAEAEAKARAEAAERAARAAEEEARRKLAQAKAAEEAAARAKAESEERARREEEARLVEEARLRELAKPKPLDLGAYIISAVWDTPVPLVEWAPSEVTIQALADAAVQYAAARDAEWMLASSRVVLRAMDASRAPPPPVYGGSFMPLDTGDLLTDILEEKTALASAPAPAPNVSGSSTPMNTAAALLSRQNSLVALLNGNGPAYVQPLGSAAAPAAPAAALPLGGLLAPLRRSISEAGSAAGSMFRPQTPPQHVPPHAAQQPGQQPPFGMPPFHMHPQPQQPQPQQQQQAVPSPGPAGFPPGPPPGQSVLFQDPAMLAAMRMDFPLHAASPVPPAPHAPPHAHAPPPPPPAFFSPHPASAFTPPPTAPRGIASPMGSSTGTLPSLPMPPAPLRATSLFQKLHDASLAGSQASSTPSSPAGPPPGFAGKVAGPPPGIVARVASPVPVAQVHEVDTPTPDAQVRAVLEAAQVQVQTQPSRATSPTPSAPRSCAASKPVVSPVQTKKGAAAEVPAVAKKSPVETRKSPVDGARKETEGKKDAKPAAVVVGKNEQVKAEPPVAKNEVEKVEAKPSATNRPVDAPAPAPSAAAAKTQEKSPTPTPTPAPVAAAEPTKGTPVVKRKSPSPAPAPVVPRTPSPPPERKATLSGVELTTTLFYSAESDTEDDDTASTASSAASVPMSPDLAAASDPPVGVSAAVAALAQVDLAQLAAALDAWVRDPSLAVPAGNAMGNATTTKKGGAGKKGTAASTTPAAPAVSVSPASAAAIATPSKAQRQWMRAVTVNISSFFDAGVAALFGAPVKVAPAAPANPTPAKVEDEDKGHAALTALLQQLAAEVAQVELASEEDLAEMEAQIKAAKKEVQQWDLRVKQVVKKNRKAGLV
ncbi:transcriptional repressor general negative regulator of transcription subunit 4 [Allomyces arbusculus]|nr:transcriptional repressor general negative regulator of transcription subunit 4 [Allomyces arbusculus]